MLNPYAKFQGFMLKGFKDMLTLISHVSSVLVQCITSLAQAVTSQAEKREPIKSVFIVVMPEYLSGSTVLGSIELLLSRKKI